MNTKKNARRLRILEKLEQEFERLMEYDLVSTPYGTDRLWIYGNWAGHQTDHLHPVLNYLSCWGGEDKTDLEKCIISWEFDKNMRPAIIRLMQRYQIPERK